MNRLVITPLAAADLEDIASYIAKEDPAAALRMIERLEEISILLKDHPHIGVARDDIAKGMRVFPVGNYLILFRVLDKGVQIVRYVHGARELRGLA